MFYIIYFKKIRRFAQKWTKCLRVRWDYQDKKLSIDFDRAPYIQLGYQEHKCQGKDKIIGKKQKYHSKKNVSLTQDHCFLKSRRTTQVSKKIHCTAILIVKKIFCFPEFKINENKNRKKIDAAKNLKNHVR